MSSMPSRRDPSLAVEIFLSPLAYPEDLEGALDDADPVEGIISLIKMRLPDEEEESS